MVLRSSAWQIGDRVALPHSLRSTSAVSCRVTTNGPRRGSILPAVTRPSFAVRSMIHGGSKYPAMAVGNSDVAHRRRSSASGNTGNKPGGERRGHSVLRAEDSARARGKLL